MPMPDIKQWTRYYSVQRWFALGLAGLSVYLYLWGVAYYLWFIRSDEAFEKPPWFILQVIAEGNAVSTKPLVVTGLLVLLITIGAPIAMRLISKSRNIFGDAHFANELEIHEAGLRSDQGILLGKYHGRYLCHGDDGHVLVYAPTGSGKGVSTVIPNLLNWPGSLVCLDIKQENFLKTSGFRTRHGQRCYLFDPLNPEGRTARYNHFDTIGRRSSTRVNEIQKIAYLHYPPHNDKGDIWNPSARSLFIAVVLYLLDRVPNDCCAGGVLRFIGSSTDLKDQIETILDSDPGLDPLCIQNFRGFLQKESAKERSGVVSSLRAGLELWENPLIDAATSASDFDLARLRAEPMSVYVGVTPDNLDRLSLLLNIFFQQFVDLMTRREPGTDEPYEVLGLFDEFTSMGRVPIVEKGIAFLRSYGVKLMVVIQSISQLESKDLYGVAGARTFMQNFKIKSVFAPNDNDTANNVSRMLGFKTVYSTSTSRQSGGKVSHSSSASKRELMMAHEVMQLNKKKAIVFVEANSPVLARKIVYYKDRNFKSRLLPPAAVPTMDMAEFMRRRARRMPNIPTRRVTDEEVEQAMELFQ